MINLLCHDFERINTENKKVIFYDCLDLLIQLDDQPIVHYTSRNMSYYSYHYIFEILKKAL